MPMHDIQNHGGEKWQEQDSKTFIDYGSIFVPDRGSQYETISKALPIENTDDGYIMELCCGEGILARKLLETYPHVNMLLFDGSQSMLDAAKKNLIDFKERVRYSLFDLAAKDWRVIHHPIRACISSLAIHHLDDLGKIQLFGDIFQYLEPGGAFIIADIVQPTTDFGVSLASEAWDKAVRLNSLATFNNVSGYEYFKKIHWNMFTDPEPDKSDNPSPLFLQLKWLECVGYSNVDVFWMQAAHAIFGGYKN